MSEHEEINEAGSFYKAVDTLLSLLAGSAMVLLSLSFLTWLRF